LSGNRLYLKTGAELATAFAGIKDSVTHLNLSWSDLHHKTVAELVLMNGCLPNITTVTLSVHEIQDMTQEQRYALKAIFPSVKTRDIILLEDDGFRLPPGKLSTALSLLSEVPSLQALAASAFFNHTRPTRGVIDELPVPNRLKNYLNSF
jgi:hypothetical protein